MQFELIGFRRPLVIYNNLTYFISELLEREPQVLGEVLPQWLHRQHPHQLDAGHEAHLHRHQDVATPVWHARQKVESTTLLTNDALLTSLSR